MAYMTDASGVLGALQTELATKNSTSKKAGKDLTTDDFLVLMCAMFQNQDIDNTASTADMMNQFVQISVIQAVTDISSLIHDTSTLTYASSLVGKTVTIGMYEGNELKEIEGVVTGTGTLNGEQVIFIGDDIYMLSDIMAIGKLPEVKDPEKPDGDGTEDGDGTDGVDKPGNTEKPDGTDKPDNTEKPDGTTDKPENTEKPDGTTDKPENTEKPDGTTDKPENTEKPDGTTDKPENTEKPDGTNKPDTTEKPDTTDKPGTTDKTDGTDVGTDNNGSQGNPNKTINDYKMTRPLLA